MYSAYCVAIVLSREQCLVRRLHFCHPCSLICIQVLFCCYVPFYRLPLEGHNMPLITIYLLTYLRASSPCISYANLIFRVFIWADSIYIYIYIYIYIKVKVKWSLYRSGVAQRVGRGIALLFHDRGTRRGWVVSSTSRPHFTLGKDPVPILQEIGWAPGPVWTDRKSHRYRDSIPDRPARSQSLYRPSYPAQNIYMYIYTAEGSFFLGNDFVLGVKVFPTSARKVMPPSWNPGAPRTIALARSLHQWLRSSSTPQWQAPNSNSFTALETALNPLNTELNTICQ